MITLESTFKILKKYGYNSKTVHPYLYKKNNEIGLNYSYIDTKYGVTERVASFYSDLEFEKFLKRIQWYKLNGKKYGVAMRLNNYEISNPEVLYIRNNHVMTDDEIFDIESYDKKIAKNKKLSHKNRLLVEASNLMNRYYIEKEFLEKYTNNLYNKERELNRYYVELQKLVDKYNKVKRTIELEEDTRKFKADLESESVVNLLLANYTNKIPSEDELYALIRNIWELNKNIELNKDYLYAYKVNDDIDEEMRLVVTKIDFMKELLSKKRLFKIVNLKKKFENIDNQSTYESIYDDKFEDKYCEFINKKYDVLDELDEFKLCEYLNNFKTNKSFDIERNINRCKSIIDEKENYDVSIDDIYKKLKKQFKEHLNNDEKAALILYNSIYNELITMVQNIDNFNDIDISKLISILKQNDNYNMIIKDCYNNVSDIIDLDVNKKIKDTVFYLINFDNEESFIKSLVKIVNIIININDKMVLKDNVKLYFSTNDFDSLGKDSFIKTSSIIAPYMYKSDNKNYRVINAHIKKGINVLFSPQSIILPLNNTDNLVIELVNDESPDIYLDTRDILINKDNNLTIYSRFKKHMIEGNEFNYVDKMIVDYKININRVIIEKRS